MWTARTIFPAGLAFSKRSSVTRWNVEQMVPPESACAKAFYGLWSMAITQHGDVRRRTIIR